MTAEIKLAGRTVRAGSRPYIIAEIGVNHEGSMDLARRLIDECKEGGADAAKFQTYKAGKLASKHSPAYWDTSKEKTESQFKLFQKYDQFGPDEYAKLAEHCGNIGIDFMSTPFDADAVEVLTPLLPVFKIASADLTNLPLLRHVAGKGKPVILSTGASTLGEVDVAVQTLRLAGCQDIALLHCVLNYPCLNRHANLNMMDGLRRAYPEIVIGYSDHTVPEDKMLVLTAAWLKGAAILEKHFTHDKTLPGNDHYHAMNKQDLRNFCDNLDFLAETMGSSFKAPLPEEAPAREHARRSIVIERPLAAGATITEADITYKRPGHGISPLQWDTVLGRKVSRALEADHILQWSDIA